MRLMVLIYPGGVYTGWCIPRLSLGWCIYRVVYTQVCLRVVYMQGGVHLGMPPSLPWWVYMPPVLCFPVYPWVHQHAPLYPGVPVPTDLGVMLRGDEALGSEREKPLGMKGREPPSLLMCEREWARLRIILPLS